MPHRALRQTDHRDLPLPGRAWAMSMRWTDLLFMHWPIDPDVVREVIPGDFDLDLYDGQAWVGVVPFRIQSTRPRFCPPIPQKIMPVSVSSFPELNVRTYVTANTKDGPLPGVVFFSLDAASKSAVRIARHGFRLPYFDAQMKVEHEPGDSGWTHFQSVRSHYGAPPARFAASYRAKPTMSVYREEDPSTKTAEEGLAISLKRDGRTPRNHPASEPGSFEHYLTERYRFFTLGRKGRGVRVCEVAHEPWPLQEAECELSVCEVTNGLGFDFPDHEPVLHYAKDLRVVAWWPRRV